MDHILSHDTPTTSPQTFSHPGITFDPKNYKIHFSDEAKNEFQKIIDTIQSQLKLDAAKNKAPISDANSMPITPKSINQVVDGMIVEGKGKKSIKKFVERVIVILGKKKKGSKTVEKIEKKVQKYSNKKCMEIIVGYIEKPTVAPGNTEVLSNPDPEESMKQNEDEKEKIFLKDIPIRVWEGQDIATILNSLNTRLGYTQVISKTKKSSH